MSNGIDAALLTNVDYRVSISRFAMHGDGIAKRPHNVIFPVHLGSVIISPSPVLGMNENEMRQYLFIVSICQWILSVNDALKFSDIVSAVKPSVGHSYCQT